MGSVGQACGVERRAEGDTGERGLDPEDLELDLPEGWMQCQKQHGVRGLLSWRRGRCSVEPATSHWADIKWVGYDARPSEEVGRTG